MMNKRVPKIRFKGFVEEWEEKKIIDFAPLQRGFDLPISQIVDGSYPVVFSNGILKTHNEFKVKSPGVVTGRSGTIGKVIYVRDNFWPHNTALWVTDFHENHPMYVFYFYETFKLDRFGTGSGVPTLNRNDIHPQTVFIPKPTEQTQIGNYFQNIDKLIEKSQKKLDKLKNIKKSCLQKMFPKQGVTIPEVRFRGFGEEWDKKKLGSFCYITIGEFVIQTKQRNRAPYPVYNGGISYTGFYDEYNKEGNKIIISARGANAGFVNKSETRYWAGNSCYSIEVLDSTNWILLYYIIKEKEQYFRRIQQSANIPSVSKKQVEELLIISPKNITEQTQIGNFFKNLDDLISKNEQQLTKLKNIKKACLEKMFVNTTNAL